MSYFNKVKVMIGDSLQNVMTGLGIATLDKSVASTFVDVKLSYAEKENAYSSDWLVSKVCDLPPYDMTRAWRTIKCDFIEPEETKEWDNFERRIQLRKKVKEAMTWGRVYGGAGIIINVDDGQTPDQPLDLSRIKKDGLRFLVVVDEQFLNMSMVNQNPLSSNFGYPETYRMSLVQQEIHHTRVIRFEGLELPLQSRRRNRYWGKSIIEVLHSALVRAAEVQESIGTLIHEATVDVIRIPDLMEMITDPDTEAQLQKRFGVAKMQKSVNRTLLMDIQEEYEQHNQTFAGLTDMIEKFLSIVAGAADIPITRLLGQSPAGMNSTGESDLRNYYDMLSARQETELRPKLEYLDQIIYRSLFGKPPEEEIHFEFNPLWQMSEQEKAELESSRATRDSQYMTDNVINEAIVARDLMERKTYSGVTAEYVEEMEELMKEKEDEEEQDPEAGEEEINSDAEGKETGNEADEEGK